MAYYDDPILERIRVASGGEPIYTAVPAGIKSATQQNQAQPQQQEKPTTRSILGKIAEMSRKDPEGGRVAFQQFQQFQQNSSSSFFNPYTQATNRSVANLANMGVDVSNMDDDWFNQMNSLKQYYQFNGTTNTPSKPSEKKASPIEMAAYEFYQIDKSRADTESAKSELAALKEEVAYWASRKDLNLSDEEIIQKIGLSENSKYKTLAKMDATRLAGTPMELNEAIDYCGEDSLYGMIWAARNNGGTGSSYADMANSYNGAGRIWKDNEDIRGKLAIGTDTYDPYSVSMTGLDEEGLYFGRAMFNQQWIDENRAKYLGSGDESAIKFFNRVQAAEEYTQKVEKERDAMKKEIDRKLEYYDTPEDLLNSVYKNKDYSDLYTLDATLKTGELKSTTRAVNYSRKDVEEYVRQKFAEKDALKDGTDLANEANASPEASAGPQGASAPADGETPVQQSKGPSPSEIKSEARKAVENYAVATLARAGDAVMSFGTEEEQTAFVTGLTATFDEDVEAIQNGTRDPSEWLQSSATQNVVNDYFSQAFTVYEYEQHEANRDELQQNLDSIQERWQELTDRQSTMGAVADMTQEQFLTLTDLMEDDSDTQWVVARSVLSAGKDGMYTSLTDALDVLYQRVTGEPVGLGDGLEANRDKAQNWWNFISGSQMGTVTVDQLIEQNNGDGGISREISEDVKVPGGGMMEVILHQDEDGYHFYEAVYNGEIYTDQNEVDSLLAGPTNTQEYDFLSEDEVTELQELTRQKDYWEEQLQAEEEYLADEKNLYDMAVAEREGLRQDYVTAALANGGDTTLLDTLDMLYAAGRTGQTEPQYTAFNYYDAAVQNGDITREQATTYASYTAVQDARAALQLEDALKLADSLGMNIPDEQRANINAKIQEIRREAISNGYLMLDGLSDFTDTAVSAKESALSGKYGFTAYLVANGGEVDLGNLPSSLIVDSASKDTKENTILREMLASMTEDERNRYLYLMEKEGKDKAQAYLDSLTDEERGILVTRRSQQMSQGVREFASENAFTGILSTGLSFLSNFAAGPDALIYEVGNMLAGKNINPYNYRFDNMLTTEAARAGAKEQFVKWLGGDDTFGGTVAELLYDGFTSAGDSWINAQMMNGLMGAVGEMFSGTRLGEFARVLGMSMDVMAENGSWAGKIGKFALKAGSDLTHASTMGLSAAAASYRDVIERFGPGAEEQAMRMAVATFWAETGSEAITVGNLHEAFSNAADMKDAASLLVEFVKNGAEEALGEGANEWIEQNAERLIMGEKSEYEQTAQALIDQGYPESVAYAIADKQMWGSILRSAATGFISSAFGTASETVRGKIYDHLTENAVNSEGVENQEVSPENAPGLTEESVNEAPSEEAPVTEETVSEAPEETPVTEETVSEELQAQDQAALANMEANEAAAEEARNQFKKDLATLSTIISGTTNSGATAGMTSVLGGGYTAKTAAKKLMINIAGGNTKMAARLVNNLLLADQSGTVKEAIVKAALTDGHANEVLKDLFNEAADGETATTDDVNILLEALAWDQNNRPDFETEYQRAIKNSRVADKMMGALQIDLSHVEAIESAQDATDQANKNLETAQSVLAQAEADLETARGDLAVAANEQLQGDATDPALNGPVEQAAEAVDAAVNNVQQQEQAVNAAQENADKAAKKQKQTTEEHLAQVRAQAEAEVEQEMQQEAEAAEQQQMDDFQSALSLHPTSVAFPQPITRQSKNGPVQLTGILFNDDNYTIYSTTDGYITEMDLTDTPGKDILKVIDSWKPSKNKIPSAAVWLGTSVRAQHPVNGNLIDIVGIAGKIGYFDVVDPVVMDMEGNLYNGMALSYEGSGGAPVFDAFDAAIDNDPESLPEYTQADLYTAQTGVQLPEGAVAYPGDPQKVYYGQDIHYVVGMIPSDDGSVSNSKYVTTDGQSLDAANAMETMDLLNWALDYYQNQIAEEVSALSQNVTADQTTNEQTTTTDQTTNEQPADEYSEGKVNPKTGAPLKNWQNPKYHGVVEKTTKKVNPKTKAFKKFFDQNAPEALPYVTNPDGTPRLYYRGYGYFGETLYTVHQSKPVNGPNGKKMYLNFYMDQKSTAATYAGTNKIAELRYSKNWETAKAAMQDIGYDLVEKQNPTTGEWGYQVVNTYGSPAVTNGPNQASTWFAENSLAKFNATYGGELKSEGIHVGYVAISKPLIIDCHGSSFTSVYSGPNGITAPDGATFTGTQKTRRWAEWAFQHGYNGVIFKDVKDNVSGGGAVGIEVVTSQSAQFKSVYNKGTWNPNDPTILAKKQAKQEDKPKSKQLLDLQEGMEAGKALEDMTKDERLELAQKMHALPEVMDAKAKQSSMADTLPWNTQSAIRKATSGANLTIEDLRQAGVPAATIRMIQNGADYVTAIESLFTPEAVNEQHKVRDEMAKQGSVEFDAENKPHYTGEVRQNKRLDVVAGLPASGKSTLAEALSAFHKSRMLDSDDAKKLHKDYAEGANSSPLHNESRFIMDQAMAMMIANGDNVILPVVGHSYSSLKRQIATFRANGYDVHLHNVQLPWAKALSRSLNRLVETGRLLDINYLLGVDSTGLTPQKINDTFNQLIEEGLVDGYATWDNDVERGKPPVAVSYSDAAEVGITTGAFGRLGTGEGRGNADTAERDAETDRSAQIQALKIKNQTPTQKQAEKVKAKLKSPHEIARKMINNLGIGNYMGSNRFGRIVARGFYDLHGKYIAVHSNDLGNYTVTMHEAGHAIADKLKMTGTADMVSNLVSLDPSFAAAYNPSQLADEAFAEFFWRYMESEERARRFAGDTFYEDFERRLIGNQELWDAVQEAREELQQYVSATADERLATHIKYEQNGNRQNWKSKFLGSLMDIREFIQKGLMDQSAAAAEIGKFAREQGYTDMQHDVRSLSLLSNHSQKQVIAMLTDTLTDANHNRIADGFAKQLSAIGFTGSDEEIHAMERYGLAEHALGRNEQRKRVFGEDITDADLKDIIKNTPEKIKQAEEIFQNFRKQFLQAWLVDTGYWSQEFFDMLNELNPHYMPTFRVLEGTDGFGGRFAGARAKRYTLHEATGSSQDIYSPWYSWIGMMDQIVTMVNNNQAALAFDRLYQENAGMGKWGRQIMGDSKSSTTPSNNGELNSRQQKIRDMLDGKIDNDLMEDVLAVLKSQPGVNNINAPGNVLSVQRPDGTVVQYEMYDPYLYRLLAGVQATTGIQGLRAVGALTRTMSMLTTGSNPLFAARNAVRDYQTSVNSGTWASSYLTGIPKWMKSLVEVAKGTSEDYQNYVAMGGGGWTRIDQNNAQSMNEVNEQMFGEARNGKTAKWAGKKVWDLVTFARVNEIIEQASRFAEYKYGNHDLTTTEGKQGAFLAAQEVTVDFSRRGNSGLASVLQKVVPFFNASTQGVYRTGRQFTEAESDRAAIRFTKNIVNTALTSALSLGLILKFCDDEDKEEFADVLSDGVKANHLILPNPLATDGSNGQPPFLRIPLAQDPVTYLVHGFVTNALWNGTHDGTAIELAAISDVILDNLNPLGSGTIIQPVLDASHNRTWYGGQIVRTSQQDWTDPASQYNEDTSWFFRAAGQWTNTSPEILEYLATQYTGFLGATLIPMATAVEQKGLTEGLKAIPDAITKKWTTDPLSSNDVTSYFFDMAAHLGTIVDEGKKGRPQGLLLGSLTQEQVNEAYLAAETMTKGTGLVGATREMINETWKEIDAINGNDTLTDAQKYSQTSDLKRKMLKQVQLANEQLQGYQNKYMHGESLVDKWFANLTGGNKFAEVPTDVQRLPQIFQDDMNDSKKGKYLEYAQNAYDTILTKDGKKNANLLPHPTQKITINDVEYNIPDEEWDKYLMAYRDAYMETVYTKYDPAATDEEKKKVFSGTGSAHSAGMAAIRELYRERHGIE